MSELTFEVKEFIEQNIDLIEENRWDEVYDNSTLNLDSESTGRFTRAILDLGIDPLQEQGLDYIPDYYLSDQDITSFIIPNSIKLLSEGCFSYTSLKSIVIPDSVEQIQDYVFYECSNLQIITFLGDVQSIGEQIIYGCPENLVIRCHPNTTVSSYFEDESVHVEYI